MKLVHPEWNFQIQLPEGAVLTLVIENASAFFRYAGELHRQAEGEEGAFVLSESGSPLKLNKELCFLSDPFAVTLHQRPILNKVYALIQQEVNEGEGQACLSDISRQIHQLLENASASFPFPLQYSDRLECGALLKAMQVTLYQQESSSLLEQFIDYIKITSQLLQMRVFVLHHMQAYLEKSQWAHLQKMAQHTKTTLLFLENSTLLGYNPYQGRYIIDADLCEIH